MVCDLTILLISKTSYEEERSQIDFDDVVRQNQEKYRGETKLSNEQVEIVLHSRTISCSLCTSRFLTTLLARRGRTGLTSVSFLLGPKVNLELIYDFGVFSD